MSRGKKILALVPEINNLRDESQNVISRSNYDPNKVIHILDDITLHYSESREDTLEISDASNINYGINDEINITTQTDMSSNLLKENIDTTFPNIIYPSTIFNDIHSDNLNSITDQNLIIVSSQIETVSETTDTLTLSNLQCSDMHTIQTLDLITPEQSLYLHQDIPQQHSLVTDKPLQTISLVVPDPLISDDSDRENKLVPYSDSDSDSLNELNEINNCKKRKKRFEVDRKQWLSEKNKHRREEGKTFFGREKVDGGWNYKKPKEARSMKARCSCKIGKYSTLKCETLDEDARKEIFKRFWSLTWGEKKTLINEWVTTIPTVRPRNRNTKDSTKRAKTFVYYLKVNEERVKVCRKMFLNTLDLGRWTVQHWKQDFVKQPTRNSMQPIKSISEPKESLIKFLDSLPVMESHYCRATSQKLYLLPEWNSKESLYQFYAGNWCKERNVKALSIALFSNVFESKNLSLFKPKKDQCEKCACFKVGQVTEEEYKGHIQRKNEAREEKNVDKEGEHFVFTVDLQAVLMAPKSNVSTLYYRTKLQVHNLCFFNIKNKDGFCFIWNEVEGGLNAEEFASIWSDFLENEVIPEINNYSENTKKTIIIYSDGCTYQNRNCVLSNALLNIVMKHENIVIEQKFLEVGHTQMEADAMHSTIERHLKNRVINVPAEYVSIAKHARKYPAPYIVKYLDYSYFKKFDKIQFYKSIRPGRTKGDPKVTDIRALRYENDTILYKTCFKDEWQPLPQRRCCHSPCEITNLKQLYQSRRKITARKFEDLQQIKRTLPSDYHKYYDDLPHE